MENFMDIVKLVTENGPEIVAAVGAIIVGAGALAELTPWEWDNRGIMAVRKFWARIPVFGRDPLAMGTGKPKSEGTDAE